MLFSKGDKIHVPGNLLNAETDIICEVSNIYPHQILVEYRIAENDTLIHAGIPIQFEGLCSFAKKQKN